MRKVLVMIVTGFLPLAALAAGDISPNGGTDSCGLGWKVTDKKSLMATCTRGTTNGVVPPTSGMTTGTIGCEKHTIAKADAKGVEFVTANYDSLRLEMAAGQGENLAALARTMGCADANVDAFGRAVQGNYETVVGNGSRIELFQNAKNVAVSACAI